MAEPSRPPAGAASVAVVGLACRFPDADDPPTLLDTILTRRRAFRRLPPSRLDLDEYDAGAPARRRARAGLIEGWTFDREAFRIPAPAYRSADPAHWLALETAARALAAAGFPGGTGLDRDRIGVIFSHTPGPDAGPGAARRTRWPDVRRVLAESLFAGEVTSDRASRVLRHAARCLAPLPRPGAEPVPASQVTIPDRISSYFGFRGGSHAVDSAGASSLQAVASACAALAARDIDVAVAGGVDLSLDPLELAGLTPPGQLATGAVRIFDENPTGYLPGEGCGVVVLMRAAQARAAGLPVYAEIAGWGTSAGGLPGVVASDASSQLLALRRAYERARVDPREVQFIEGHGSGTSAGDDAELIALAELREGARDAAALGSIKANIGHAKAAAGVAGLIKTVLALGTGVIPPTTGVDRPHPLLRGPDAPFWLPEVPEEWPSGPRLAGVSALGMGGVNVHLVLRGTPSRGRYDRMLRVLPRLARPGSGRDRAACTGRAPAPAARPVPFLLHAADRQQLGAALARVAQVAAWLSDAELTDLACQLGRDARLQGRARAAIVARDQEELARLAGEAAALLPGLRPGVVATRPGIFAADNADGRVTLLLSDEAGADVGAASADMSSPEAITHSLAALRWLESLQVSATAAVGHGLGEIAGLAWAGVLGEAEVTEIAALRAEFLRGPAVRVLVPAGRAAGDLEGAGSPAPDAVSRLRASMARFRFGPPRRRLISTLTGRELATSDEVIDLICGGLSGQGRLAEAVTAGAQGTTLLVETGPGRLLAATAARACRVPTVSLGWDEGPGPDLAWAAAGLFAAGALEQVLPLFADQPFRPIDLWRDQVFITEPGQAADPASAAEAAAEARTAQTCTGPAAATAAGARGTGAGATGAAGAGTAANRTGPATAAGAAPGPGAPDIEPPGEWTGLPAPAGGPDRSLVAIASAGHARPTPRPTADIAAEHVDIGQLDAGQLDAGHTIPRQALAELAVPGQAVPEQAVPERVTVGGAVAAGQARWAPGVGGQSGWPSLASAGGGQPGGSASTDRGDPGHPGGGAATAAQAGPTSAGRAQPGPDSISQAPGGTVQAGQPRAGRGAAAGRRASLPVRPQASLPGQEPPTGVAGGTLTGLASWARCFTEGLSSAAVPQVPGANRPWRIVVAGSYPFRPEVDWVFAHDPAADRSLAIIGDPTAPGAMQVALLAAQEARRTGRLVAIATGPGLTGFLAALQAEQPSLGVTVLRIPATPGGLRSARQYAGAEPGQFREVVIDVDGTAREPVPVACDVSGGTEVPLDSRDVVLVSRASSGAALALAQVLAACGSAVAVLGRVDTGDDGATVAGLEELRLAGARVTYEIVDPASPADVALGLQRIERRHGPVTAVAHCVGAADSVPIADLTASALESHLIATRLVLRDLLAPVTARQLRLILTFGSTAARYGLPRQGLLAAASAALASQAEAAAAAIPGCRALHVEVPGWSASGLGTWPGLAASMAEAGMAAIGVSDVSRLLLKALATPGVPGRIALHGRISAPGGARGGGAANDLAGGPDSGVAPGSGTGPDSDRPHSGGQDSGGGPRSGVRPYGSASPDSGAAGLAARQAAPPPSQRVPGLFRPDVVVHYPGIELVREARLSLATDPYLADYRVDGLPVLPAVLALEALAQVASALAGRPLRRAAAVSVAAPVVLRGDDPTLIRLSALADDDKIIAALRSEESGMLVDHVRAEFRWDDAPADEPWPASSPAADALGRELPAGAGAGGAQLMSDAADSVDGADLYGPICFASGRFRRIAALTDITSRSCRAVARGADEPAWFPAGEAGGLLLGSPGLNDAVLQALQACVPDRRVWLASCDTVSFSGAVTDGAAEIRAIATPRPAAPRPAIPRPAAAGATASQAGVSDRLPGPSPAGTARSVPDRLFGLAPRPARAAARLVPAPSPGEPSSASSTELTWDVAVIDAAGRALATWRGVRLREAGPLPRDTPWPPTLLAVCLERGAAALGLDPALRMAVRSGAAALPDGPADLSWLPGTVPQPRSAAVAPGATLAGPAAGGWAPDGSRPDSSRPGGSPPDSSGPDSSGPDSSGPGADEAAAFLVQAGGARYASCGWAVADPHHPVWPAGRDDLAAAFSRLCSHLSEPPVASAARLQAIAECLAAAQGPADAPVLFDRATEDGWALLTVGSAQVACTVVPVRGLPWPIAIAVTTDMLRRDPRSSRDHRGGRGAGRRSATRS